MSTPPVPEPRSGPRASPAEAWLERRIGPYRYELVLLLLLVTYVTMATAPPDPWAQVITVALEGITLLAVLVASRVGRVLFRVACFVVAVAVLSAALSAGFGSTSSTLGWFFAVNVLLVGAAPVVIARTLYRRPVVDARTVLGAVCVYLLIGIMFAFAYGAIDVVDADPFFVQTDDADLQTYLYFSFVTQTTVGYGDYTAAADLGRTLATTEALAGQLYLVTVIAVLVSRMGTVKPTRPAPSDPDED